MNSETIKNLKADEFGRFILDLQTPAEKTVGRVLGCFSKLGIILGPIFLLSLLSSDFSLSSKFLRIVGLAMVIGFFYYCRRSIDCYYVLDDVGGQLLYHFSAILMVSEDPVANLEDVAGVGVSYSGVNLQDSSHDYAVVFCLVNGKIIRVSNFITRSEANQICENVAQLISVPFMLSEPGENLAITWQNGKMLKSDDSRIISAIRSDSASGCLSTLIVGPYIFFPTMMVFMVALMIVSGDSTERDLNYYLKHHQYKVINADGKPFQHSARKKRTSGKAEQNGGERKYPGELLDHRAEIASGTIVPGRGINNVVEIGEEMKEVCQRFGIQPPPDPAEPLPKPGYDRVTRKYIKPREHRIKIFAGAVSVVFVARQGTRMTVERIEIFKGKELPFKTEDGIGFNKKVEEIFPLGGGRVSLKKRLDEKLRRKYHETASFFTTSRRSGNGFESGYGADFAKEGISYTFFDDRLNEITITRKKR